MLQQLGTLDAVIIAILAVGMTVGLFQGVIRQVLLLGAIYFGIVLAAQYYLVVATGIAVVVPGGEPRAYSTISLLLVFVVSTLAINAIGYLTYSSTRIPLVAVADHAGGAIVGVMSAWLFVSLLLAATDFATSVPIAGLWQQDRLVELLRQSALVPLVHDSMPVLIETLRPWLPAGVPAPFAT